MKFASHLLKSAWVHCFIDDFFLNNIMKIILFLVQQNLQLSSLQKVCFLNCTSIFSSMHLEVGLPNLSFEGVIVFLVTSSIYPIYLEDSLEILGCLTFPEKSN